MTIGKFLSNGGTDSENESSNEEDKIAVVTEEGPSDEGSSDDIYIDDSAIVEAAQADDESGPSAMETLSHWAEGTSIHGLAQMTDFEMTLWYRKFWLAVTIAGGVVMIWQIAALVRDYRAYEVTTDTVTVWPASLEFPDVTVCNLNLYMKSRLQQHNISKPRTVEEFRLVSQGVDELFLATGFNDEDFPNLTAVWHETFTDVGRCYTFRTQELVDTTGFLSGLSFIGDIMQREYMADSIFAGLYLYVTQQGVKPTSADPFVVARPGKFAHVSIKSTNYHRIRKNPWRRCTGEAPLYTSSQCRSSCVEKAVREHCQCRLISDEAYPDMEFCVGERSECRGQINDTAALEACGCDLPPCDEVTYSVANVELDMSDAFLEDFTDSLLFFTPDFVEAQLALVGVSFEAIKFEESREREFMTFNELLGAIGGSMGLFLGVSALSFVELADLFIIRLLPRCFGVRRLNGVGSKKAA